MKTSGRALATTLLAVAASAYAVTSNAGPHGGPMGFHGMSPARFPATYGIAGTGRDIAGTGRGIAGTGNGIAGTGNGIAGTGNGIAGTGNGIAGTGNGIAGTGNGI